MRNLNHLGLIPRVLNDFQRGIKGSGSSRHCHLEAVPHFRKPVSASSARDPAVPVGWSVKVEQLRTSYKPFTVYSMISLNDPSHAANTTQVSWAAESLPHQSFAGILQSMASWANRWCWRQWHWKETPSRCSQSDSINPVSELLHFPHCLPCNCDVSSGRKTQVKGTKCHFCNFAGAVAWFSLLLASFQF